jgi:hypothetical protein
MGYFEYSHCAIAVLTQDAHMPYSGHTWRTQNSEYSQEYSVRYCEYSHLVGYCEYSHLVRYCEYSHLLSLPASQAIRARTDVQPCALPPTTLAEDHPSGSTHSTPCEYPE